MSSDTEGDPTPVEMPVLFDAADREDARELAVAVGDAMARTPDFGLTSIVGNALTTVFMNRRVSDPDG